MSIPHWLKITLGATIGTILGVMLGRWCSGITIEQYSVAEQAVDAQAQAIVLGARTIITICAGGLLGLILGTLSAIILTKFVTAHD